MPSGKTHDAITAILALPAFGAGFWITGDLWNAVLLAIGFLFGGFMFGPDLDTLSTQYSRWRFLRIVWFPYRNFFPHRSRWTHGILFGTLLRVIYFMGVVTCVAFGATWVYLSYAGDRNVPGWDFVRIWMTIRAYTDAVLGENGVVLLFVGMWVGAASHIVTDLAGTYVRTGRRSL